MGDFTPQIAASGAVILLSVVIGATFRLLNLQGRRDATYEDRIADLEADLLWCGQQRSELITHCQKSGLQVPASVWQVRPARRSPKTRKGRSKHDAA